MVASPSFLVDNSVWARIPSTPSVKSALLELVSTHGPSSIMVCAPVVAEVGFSARNGKDHSQLWAGLSAFTDCPNAPNADDTLAIQNALWRSGLVRAVGAMDALIAAYAIANNAAVLHFDSDFDHVASVVPAFRHAWIVPRGSVG
jgi:predicted nucleic acid-binding protein